MLDMRQRTNFVIREKALQLAAELGPDAPTAAARWFGSQLSIGDARRHLDFANATTVQVVAGAPGGGTRDGVSFRANAIHRLDAPSGYDAERRRLIWPGPIVENADQARRTVAEQQAAGYDFLKVYARLSRDAYDAILREGEARNIAVAGHVPDAVGLPAALRSGIKSIEHLSGYEMLARKEIRPGEEASWARLDESRFATIALDTAKSGVWNCPTLVLFQHRVAPGEVEHVRELLARPEMRYVSPKIVRSWQPENNYLKNSTPARAASSREKGDVMRKKLVGALHAAGARLLLGTDYGNPFVVPGFSLQLELRNFVDAGLSPFDAIRAGTSGAAEFMNAASEWGTVAPGRRADLILLEGNPLEDVTVISRPAGVMVRGKWFSRAELNRELEALARRFRPRSE